MPAMTMTKPAKKAQLAVFLGFVDLISERYGLDRALGDTAALIEEASEDAVRAWLSARGE